jgi:hypothetical protein
MRTLELGKVSQKGWELETEPGTQEWETARKTDTFPQERIGSEFQVKGDIPAFIIEYRRLGQWEPLRWHIGESHLLSSDSAKTFHPATLKWIRACIYMFLCVYVSLHVYPCVYESVCLFTQVYVWVSVCPSICPYLDSRDMGSHGIRAYKGDDAPG